MAGCCGGGEHNNHYSKGNKGEEKKINFLPLLLGIGGIIVLYALLNGVF